MTWTDDPIRDWDRHCAEQERWLAKLPKCSVCDAPLDEEMFVINDEVYCERCMEKEFKQYVEIDD